MKLTDSNAHVLFTIQHLLLDYVLHTLVDPQGQHEPMTYP